MNRAWILGAFLLAAAAVLAAGCAQDDGFVVPGQGQVRIVLASDSSGLSASTTDAMHHPGGDDALSRLESAEVTFASFLARNLDGELVDINVDLPVTVDLLEVLDGRSLALPAGSLPEGAYDQLVVVITHVRLVTREGAVVEITPPGGGWTVVLDVCPFEVVAGETVTIRLEVHPARWFRLGGEHGFIVTPEFDCRR